MSAAPAAPLGASAPTLDLAAAIGAIVQRHGESVRANASAGVARVAARWA